MNCRERKGFLYSLDALIGLIIVVSASAAVLVLANQAEGLGDVILARQAEDAMVVCSKIDSLECFEVINEVNPCLRYSISEERGVTVRREYGVLSVWADSDCVGALH